GAAGSVLAARLAAADPNLKILVLEGGPHTLNDPDVTTPGPFLKNLLPNMPRTRYYTTEPSKDLLGRQTTVQAGGCVGGGTAINFMMYTRAAASDYDDWERVYKNPGWGFPSLKPLFTKAKTYELDTTDPENHGFSGPLSISRGSQDTEMSRQWLGTALAWDKNRSVAAADVNDFHTSNAYGACNRWISHKGVRQDVAHRYLYPALQVPNTNLTLRVMCRVNKVIFEGDRAVGVEYLDLASENVPATKIVTATKLVVLSAGPIASPLILERSGIGAPEILAAAGIDVKVPLEGVGENYQGEQILQRRKACPHHERQIITFTEQYKNNGGGLLGTNGLDVGGKLCAPVELRKVLGKEWDYFQNAPDKPALIVAVVAGWIACSERRDTSDALYQMYPAARGSIHSVSDDPKDAPKFVPGWLASKADVALLMWQYKVSREIARRMPCYRGELVEAHPAFAPTSEAACSATGQPVPIDALDIKYTAADDAALETWVRLNGESFESAMGTCAMKPRAERGVVDPRLNVYGVKGLKVADLSVGPANVSANTESTALVIGEKAAVIIGEELGIKV
ncbi:alcohol oxidase, partial [Auricularia subglabra TFB-10046 SS5]